jgi:hypothetical protein
VSRLLGGAQNVTLKTLAALQAVFGEPIVTTPAQLRRDAEDGFHALADTLGLLSKSSGEPPCIVYDDAPPRHGALPVTNVSPFTGAPEAWSFGRSTVLALPSC